MNSTEVMNVDGVSPSDQQALAKVLNVDGDSLLAFVAASVVPVVVTSALAQADAAQADASQADVSQSVMATATTTATAAIVATAADKGSLAGLQVNVEASASEAGFLSGKAGADAKATASEVVGDGHVIGKVTFGQPSAWSSSLSESQPYAWLPDLRGSITKVTFSLRGTHVAGKQERAPERDRVRNVMPEQHLSEDLAIMNPVDPQEQQANDTNTDCQAWTHSWQAPLSNAGITPSDKPQEQSSVDVAVVTTKAVFSLSGGFTGHMITLESKQCWRCVQRKD